MPFYSDYISSNRFFYSSAFPIETLENFIKTQRLQDFTKSIKIVKERNKDEKVVNLKQNFDIKF